MTPSSQYPDMPAGSPGPPLSLYVHLPWCVRRCPYCDFNSHEARRPIPFDAYVDALTEDLAAEVPGAAGRRLVSVFFGGGTPSLFPAADLERFLGEADRLVGLEPGAEITLEANPGTLERGRFRAYAAAGINRVSLGVQSFHDSLLSAIGRIHDGRQARVALDELAAAGMTSFNVDLMYGLPGQTVAQACRDVDMAIAAGADHISHYQLTLEPGTPFARRPPPLPDPDTAWEMEAACAARLADAGFGRYETSAWSRPGRECVHNLNYWRFGDYIGVGAGAHGKITPGPGRVLRRCKKRRPAAYLASRDRLENETESTGADLAFEFMLNALRLSEGFETSLFVARTGLDPVRLGPALEAGSASGLLESVGSGWRPTDRGRRFLNDLQALFLPA
ncbi:MAG: radical SAM family heme chaperone HemW [Gammaproteobacteria bacterium]